MWTLKYDTNELIHETERDSQPWRTDLPRRGESGRGMDWEFGINRCKLLYTGWINNKILLYSTGNHIQYPGININGNKYKKE